MSQVVAELDSAGNLVTFYTRGAELISLHRTGETRYYQYDANGSVRLLTDGTGAVTDTYTYDAFGNLLAKTGTTVNNYLYNGEQFDANTGFYYLRARYMNPSTGTFISMDPAQGSIFDPVSLHKYLYANANPVMNRDPSGLFTMLEMGLTMAISGVISGSMNLLYYDLHGGDQSATSTRLGIFFGGFFQGALMSGGLVGLALIGTVLTSALLAIILTGLGIKSFSDAVDRFQAGDNVWGCIFLASAILCFAGASASVVRAIDIYDINVSNTSLANANAQRGSALPSEGGIETTKLYRVMSEGEYNSLNNAGKFTPYDKAMETKWFATNKTDAAEWGKLFYPDGNYKMVEIQVPTSALDDFYYVRKLDNIGPAYNAEMDFINSIMKEFMEVFK